MSRPRWADPSERGSTLETGSPSQVDASPGEAAQAVSLLDSEGEKLQGFVLRVPRWEDGLAADLQRLAGDFRIVIVGEPPPASAQVPRGTVLCAPARAPERAAIREAAAVYEVPRKQPPRLLSSAEAKLLSEGKLYASIDLTVTPQDVFSGGKLHLELLARDLLTCQALADYVGPLALALSAPDAPPRRSAADLISALRSLSEQARAVLDRCGGEAGLEAATTTEDRLTQLSAASDAGPFLAAARRLYTRVPALLEDVYLLRVLVQRPAEALEVLAMRAFVEQAQVPQADRDLWLDRCIVGEQIQFAGLIAEPHGVTTARAALDHFRSRYRGRYEAHHRAYWAESARLRARLLEAKGKVEALSKLNTLTELGPQVGEGAIEAYRELLGETAGCSLIVGVEEELGKTALCPVCALRLDQEPPAERISEILRRIERSTERQMARLSSIAVRRVLERSSDPRVEQFLKVVQASQISSLCDILDDELIGYLRRFLVEVRIDSVLHPLLSQLQNGKPPKAEEARDVLLELARVLERAFRASGRLLPKTKPLLDPARKAKR